MIMFSLWNFTKQHTNNIYTVLLYSIPQLKKTWSIGDLTDYFLLQMGKKDFYNNAIWETPPFSSNPA